MLIITLMVSEVLSVSRPRPLESSQTEESFRPKEGGTRSPVCKNLQKVFSPVLQRILHIFRHIVRLPSRFVRYERSLLICCQQLSVDCLLKYVLYNIKRFIETFSSTIGYVVPDKYFTAVTCFLTFNLSAVIGNIIPSRRIACVSQNTLKYVSINA